MPPSQVPKDELTSKRLKLWRYREIYFFGVQLVYCCLVPSSANLEAHDLLPPIWFINNISS